MKQKKRINTKMDFIAKSILKKRINKKKIISVRKKYYQKIVTFMIP